MRSPKILDVNPDPDGLVWEQDFMERLEDHVIACGGPKSSGSCPILRGKRCSKLDFADGVLFQLDLDQSDHRVLLWRYKKLLDIPIRVVCTRDQAERWGLLLEGVEVVAPPIGPAALDGFAAEVESSISD